MDDSLADIGLECRTFETRWAVPLGEVLPPPWLDALCSLDAVTPFPPPQPDQVEAVRALLRHGGFKPSGRSKPCSEYIRRAAAEGRFPRIGVMVDATNLAALHGALPVSTVDRDLLVDPLRVGIAPPGSRYVFNSAGQEIDLGGLVCLFDADGPCANAVKDAQRTKTSPSTRRTLTVIWGTSAIPGRADALLAWMFDVVSRLGGAITTRV